MPFPNGCNGHGRDSEHPRLLHRVPHFPGLGQEAPPLRHSDPHPPCLHFRDKRDPLCRAGCCRPLARASLVVLPSARPPPPTLAETREDACDTSLEDPGHHKTPHNAFHTKVPSGHRLAMRVAHRQRPPIQAKLAMWAHRAVSYRLRRAPDNEARPFRNAARPQSKAPLAPLVGDPLSISGVCVCVSKLTLRADFVSQHPKLQPIILRPHVWPQRFGIAIQTPDHDLVPAGGRQALCWRRRPRTMSSSWTTRSRRTGLPQIQPRQLNSEPAEGSRVPTQRYCPYLSHAHDGVIGTGCALCARGVG